MTETPEIESILARIQNGEGPEGAERERAERTVKEDLFATLKKARVHFEAEVLALYRFMLDPAAPAAAKGVAIGALLYFVLPLDVIPDWIPILGFTDDAAVIAAAVSWIGPMLQPYRDAAKGHVQAREARMRR